MEDSQFKDQLWAHTKLQWVLVRATQAAAREMQAMADELREKAAGLE